eukprot:656070-Hanusia_phi.AAC.2
MDKTLGCRHSTGGRDPRVRTAQSGDAVGGRGSWSSGLQRCRIGKCRGGRTTLWDTAGQQTRRNVMWGWCAAQKWVGVGSALMP